MKRLPIIQVGQYSYAVEKKEQFKIEPNTWYIRSYPQEAIKSQASGWGTWTIIVASNNPELTDLPKLRVPVQEDDVEQLIQSLIDNRKIHPNDGALHEGIRIGYKANTKQFTLEQMKESYEEGLNFSFENESGHRVFGAERDAYTFEQFIQSLTTTKVPTAIEVELEDYCPNPRDIDIQQQPKVDAEGYLVGTLKYD